MKTRQERTYMMSCCGTYCHCPLPLSLFHREPTAAPGCKPTSSWYAHLYRVVVYWLPCLPGGYICYSTNITQATNEFLKSTIKGEATPAAHIALALASLLTQAIFQAVVLLPSNFPLKVAFHLNQALGVGMQTKTIRKVRDGGILTYSYMHEHQVCTCVYASSN